MIQSISRIESMGSKLAVYLLLFTSYICPTRDSRTLYMLNTNLLICMTSNLPRIHYPILLTDVSWHFPMNG